MGVGECGLTRVNDPYLAVLVGDLLATPAVGHVEHWLRARRLRGSRCPRGARGETNEGGVGEGIPAGMRGETIVPMGSVEASELENTGAEGSPAAASGLLSLKRSKSIP